MALGEAGWPSSHGWVLNSLHPYPLPFECTVLASCIPVQTSEWAALPELAYSSFTALPRSRPSSQLFLWFVQKEFHRLTSSTPQVCWVENCLPAELHYEDIWHLQQPTVDIWSVFADICLFCGHLLLLVDSSSLGDFCCVVAGTAPQGVLWYRATSSLDCAASMGRTSHCLTTFWLLHIFLYLTSAVISRHKGHLDSLVPPLHSRARWQSLFLKNMFGFHHNPRQ